MRLRKLESPLRKTPLRTKLLQGLCVIVLALFVVPAALGLTLSGALVAGIQQERDQLDAPAREALQAVGMKQYAQCHYALLTGPDTAAFHISKYDNRVDHTDLCAALMEDAAATAGWTVAPVTAAEYAAQIPQAMAFLLPDANLVFDASYHKDSTRAFFDQETGLMVHFGPDRAAPAKQLRLDGVSVPTDGFLYGMDTHGGFLGDGQTYWAFAVPEESRSALEADLAAHGDWHVGSVPQAEYVRLHESCLYEVPALFPHPEIVFDRWYYADDFARQYKDADIPRRNSECFPAVMQETGAGSSGNWTVGFYDEDTGLFLWYEFDS